jgi:hypothetical protein
MGILEENIKVNLQAALHNIYSVQDQMQYHPISLFPETVGQECSLIMKCALTFMCWAHYLNFSTWFMKNLSVI